LERHIRRLINVKQFNRDSVPNEITEYRKGKNMDLRPKINIYDNRDALSAASSVHMDRLAANST